MTTVVLQVLAVPLTVWLICYVYLAIYHRRANLFNVLIHESGRYTLLQTVIYFNHFLRELPVDTLYVLTMFWSYRVIDPTLVGSEIEALTGWFRAALWGFLGMVLVGSTLTVGPRLTLLDLGQYRERDSVVEYGSHWQMHFLSTLVMILILALPGTFFAWREPELAALIAALFVGLSVLFKTGRKALTDSRWLLHGGREIITFTLLAVAPAFLPLAAELIRYRPNDLTLAVLGVVLLIGIYYLKVLSKTKIHDHSPGGLPVPYLIASHFFEHVLDVVYMALLLLVLLSGFPAPR